MEGVRVFFWHSGESFGGIGDLWVCFGRKLSGFGVFWMKRTNLPQMKNKTCYKTRFGLWKERVKSWPMELRIKVLVFVLWNCKVSIASNKDGFCPFQTPKCLNSVNKSDVFFLQKKYVHSHGATPKNA